MMNELNSRAQHKRERDGRVRDRIKAVLLYDKSWSIAAIFEDFKSAICGFFAALSMLAAESVLGQDFRSRVRDHFRPISAPVMG